MKEPHSKGYKVMKQLQRKRDAAIKKSQPKPQPKPKPQQELPL